MTFQSFDAPPPVTRFSIERAAFAGFRIARREPRTFLALSLASLVFTLVFASLMVVTIGPTLMRMQTMGATPDPAAAFAMMATLVPFQLAAGVVSIGYYAVVIAAVCRAVLRPEDAGVARLKAGPDELRQFLVMLLLAALLFVAYLGLVIGATLVAVLVGVAAAFLKADTVVVSILVGCVAVVAILGGLVFLVVRLSLANAYTFASGRIDLAAVWRMTRGRFWTLFGAYFLTWIMLVVLLLAFLMLEAALTVSLGGGVGGLQAIFRPDMSSLAAYYRPLQLAFVVLGSLLSGLMILVVVGAQADAYLQLTSLGAAAATVDASRSTHFGVR